MKSEHVVLNLVTIVPLCCVLQQTFAGSRPSELAPNHCSTAFKKIRSFVCVCIFRQPYNFVDLFYNVSVPSRLDASYHICYKKISFQNPNERFLLLRGSFAVLADKPHTDCPWAGCVYVSVCIMVLLFNSQAKTEENGLKYSYLHVRIT